MAITVLDEGEAAPCFVELRVHMGAALVADSMKRPPLRVGSGGLFSWQGAGNGSFARPFWGSPFVTRGGLNRAEGAQLTDDDMDKVTIGQGGKAD